MTSRTLSAACALLAAGLVLDYAPASDTAKPASSALEEPLPAGAVARLGTWRFRQGSPVKSVAYALGGKAIVSVGQQPPVRLWDASTGRLLRDFNGPVEIQPIKEWWLPVHQPAVVSPDGTKLLTGYGGKLVLHDLVSAECARAVRPLQILADAAFMPRLLAFSMDGQVVAATSQTDSRYQLWNVESGKSLRVVDAYNDAFIQVTLPEERIDPKKLPLTALAFSPDGRTFATGGSGDDLRLWDVNTGKQLRRLSLPREKRPEGMSDCDSPSLYVATLAFSPDGKMLAAGESDASLGSYQSSVDAPDRALNLWNPTTGIHLGRLDAWDTGYASIAFSPDGKVLAVGGRKGLELWGMPSKRELAAPSLGEVTSVCFSPDSRQVCCGTHSGELKFWQPAASKEVNDTPAHHGPVVGIALSPDARLVATASLDSTIGLWRLPGGGAVAKFPGSIFGPPTVGFTAEGSEFITVTDICTFWRLSNNQKVRTVACDGGGYIGYHVSLSADGKTMLEVGLSSDLMIVDLVSGRSRRLKQLRGVAYGAWPHEVCLSKAGKLGATASAKAIELWDVAAGSQRRSWDPGKSAVIGLAISPDEMFLASDDGRLIRIWDTSSGRQVGQLGPRAREPACHGPYHPHYTAPAYSPNSRSLAAPGDAGDIWIWDVAKGSRSRELRGHRGDVTCLAFDKAGRYLASGSNDTTAIIWDLDHPDR